MFRPLGSEVHALLRNDLGIAAELMLLKATDNPTGVALIAIRVYNDMGAKLDNYQMESFQKKLIPQIYWYVFLVNFICSLISPTPNLRDHFPAILTRNYTSNN